MSKLKIVLRYFSSKIGSFAKSYEIDDKYWSLALSEFESDSRNKDLWAKCLAKSNFDEGKAKSQYVKIRANDLSEHDLPSDAQVKEYLKSNIASSKEQTQLLLATTKDNTHSFLNAVTSFPIIKIQNPYIQKIVYFLICSFITVLFDTKNYLFSEAVAFLMANYIAIYLTTVNVRRNLVSVSFLVLLTSIYQLASDSRSFMEAFGACGLLGFVGYFILYLLRGRLFDEKYIPTDVFSKFVIGLSIGLIFGIPMAINEKKKTAIQKEINAEYSHLFGEFYGLCSVNQYVSKKFCEPTVEDEKFTEFCSSDIVPKIMPSYLRSEASKLIESGKMSHDVTMLLDKFGLKYSIEKMSSNGEDVCPQYRANLRGMFDKSIDDLTKLNDKRHKLISPID